MNDVNRRRFNQAGLGALVAGAMGACGRRPPVAPNVLLVIADEWRYQSTGYAGDRNAHMPVIDQFASEGVNFFNAVSGCPVCSPSRASIMTGQYPLTHGVYINDVPMAPDGVTLGEAFAKAGYATGYIGKWHLHGSPDGRYGRRQSFIPRDKRFGFDYWKVGECTHDYNHSFYYDGDDTTKRYWSGYDAIAQTADANRFIRDRVAANEPYFLVLAWGPPHFPLDSAPESYQRMFRDREIILPPNVPEADRQKAIEDLRGYYAHIAALDDCFKDLLDTLAATNSSEDTIVVFTSDHGDMMRSQGLTHKLYPWDESIRVPMLLRYPRLFGRKGRRSELPMNSPDLMPTLLDLAGIEIPESVQGTSFHPDRASDMGGKQPAATAFLSLPVPITSALSYGIAAYRGVRTSRHTYVRSINGPWLLYDNEADPFQMQNLIDQESASLVREELEVDLQRWLDKLGDQFLPPEEYVARDGLGAYLELQFPIGFVRSPWGDWESTLEKPAGAPLSIYSSIGEILGSETGRAALSRHLPALLDETQLEWRKSMSIWLLAQFGGVDMSEAELEILNRELASASL